MSPTALLCRRHYLHLRLFNTWRTHWLEQQQKSLTSQSLQHQQQVKVQHQSQISRGYQTKPTMEPPADVFHGVTDRFKGVTVNEKHSIIAKEQFSQKLQKSLDYWSSNKNRAIWFNVYKDQAEWVPILAAAGFDFHHARVGVVVMYRWLPTHEESNLPSYAHTLLGVGGLIINDNNEILVVSERYSLVPNSWKLPGGYVEPRENLIDAAIREVAEETGINCTFRSVVCLRHSHGGTFGCSDIYMVIGLKPLNLDYKRCEREIMHVQWMPVAEYLQHPQVHETNRHFVRTYLDYQQRGLVVTCRADVHKVLKKEYNLYYVDSQEQQAKGIDQPQA